MSAVAPVRPAAQRAGAQRAGASRAGAPRPGTQRPAQAPAAPRAQLTVVPAVVSASRGRVAFAILVGTILVGGLVALLMLHTLAAQDAFTLHRLERHAAALAEQEQQLAVADQQAQAPTSLAAQARALGLVPATSVRLVRHRDGTVVAVNTGQPPVVVTLPVATMSSAKPKPQVETRRHTHVQKATNSHG